MPDDGGYAPLTWGQEVLWFQHETSPASRRRNLNVLLELELDDGASVECCQSAIATLVRRHEALRTVLAWAGDELPVQAVQPWPVSDLPVTVIDGDAADSELAEMIARLTDEPFDLYADVPFRAGLVTRSTSVSRIVMILHHMVVDDWSFGLVQKELAAEIRRRACQP
jgi:hypothetical protein